MPIADDAHADGRCAVPPALRRLLGLHQTGPPVHHLPHGNEEENKGRGEAGQGKKGKMRSRKNRRRGTR